MAEDLQSLDDLLKLPLAERLLLARRLIDSAIDQTRSGESAGESTAPAEGLLALAGRFAGGPGDTAETAEEILEAEVDSDRGLATQ